MQTTSEELNKKLLGLNEYAGHRGVHLSIIQQHLKSGRLPFVMHNGRRMIDKDEADASWPIEESKPSQQETEMTSVPNISTQEAYMKAYKARLAKLDYEERSGKLINKELVRNEIFTSIRILRDAIRNIPQKIAPEVAVEVDPYKCEIIILKEIDSTLMELSELAERYK